MHNLDNKELILENIKNHITFKNGQFHYDNQWFIKLITKKIIEVTIELKYNPKKGPIYYIIEIFKIYSNCKKIFTHLKYKKKFLQFLTKIEEKKNDIQINKYTIDDNDILCAAIFAIQVQLTEELDTLIKEYSLELDC